MKKPEQADPAPHVPDDDTRDAQIGDVLEDTHEQTACRAYDIYCQRGGSPDDGGAAADWTQAEEELRNEREPREG